MQDEPSLRSDISESLISILNNLQYFAESIQKIDNVNERYGLLNQFASDEVHLRQYKFQLEDDPNAAAKEILSGIQNCLNCVFQTIFQMVLEYE